MKRLALLFLLTGCYNPRPNTDRVISPYDWTVTGTDQAWKSCFVAPSIELNYCSNDPNDPQIEFWRRVFKEQERLDDRFRHLGRGRV